MQLKYFTEKGAEDLINKYTYLLDDLFYFPPSIEKLKLISISKLRASQGFNVVFCSEKHNCTVYDFMTANRNIKYNFEEFEITSAEF